MTERFWDITFTQAVKSAQEANGSRQAYAKAESGETHPDQLTEREMSFIATRDSFYMATVSENGWPYLQHRGGPAGFVKVLGPTQLAIADYSGNRQYISVGNLAHCDRAALFFMDYPNRQRLKLLAHARPVDLSAEPDLADAIIDPGYKAKIERAMVFEVEAYDWNCPQHITPRLTMAELEPAVRPMVDRIAALEAEIERLKQS